MEAPIMNVEKQGEDHESEKHTEGRLGEEDSLHMYNLQDNPYFQSILADKDQFFTDFVEYISNGNDDNTKVNSEDGPSQVNNQLLSTQVASQVRADKNVSRRAQKSVLKTKTVQLKRNRRQSGGSAMLDNNILEKGSDFWCYATHVLEDAVKREIFLNMDDDDSRLKWL
ncbi:hypothetical protein Cgig2_029415 [Carnegiea gigantea]|uniref:Uncharacterized protein n=1 Tax=Carnegiea gigantea TaxID=171969 RepID=A0A9Q1GTB3_9CARY|nr:hypothetical protein Cgig2_029415 [Carnegiea gigantea]